MRRSLSSRIWSWMLAVLVLSSGGCGIHGRGHGFILRGDWSLELNRAGWLDCRTTGCQESGPSCLGTTATPQLDSCGDARLGTGSACGRPTLAARGLARLRQCYGCRVASYRGGPVAEGQSLSHARFHPVPTRPVFTPWDCPDGGLSVTPGGSIREPEPAPLPQTFPEVIPTPPETSQR